MGIAEKVLTINSIKTRFNFMKMKKDYNILMGYFFPSCADEHAVFWGSINQVTAIIILSNQPKYVNMF